MQSHDRLGKYITSCPPSPVRRNLLFAAGLGVAAMAVPGASAYAAAGKQSAALAMIGEPQTLDPMLTTADLVGTIMQHVYEPLYTFDASWNIVPMLAESLPEISEGGKRVVITLRKGVTFHDGRALTAQDVVASLKRWMAISPRGKAVGKELEKVEAGDDLVVSLQLLRPYAPLLAQLALPSSMAAIMPAHTMTEHLSRFIGTGPYKLKDRKPDQYTLLERFDDYAARPEAATGYGGARMALIRELRFVPVPDSNTRVEGVLSGQFDYADLLPVESISRVERGGSEVKPLIADNFGFPYLVFNTKVGTLASVPLRQAAQTAIGAEELMAAAFGDPRFFKIGANFFPKGTPYYSDAGADHYNVNNPGRAKEMAVKASYDGKPIRILASRQYEFHYNIAVVLAEQFKRAGFQTDLQVVDWATLLQRRNDPSVWDIYVTHSGQLPEPMLSPPQLGDGAPGWWDTPEKNAVLRRFNQETDLEKRAKLWGDVQKVVYEQVPFIELGKFNSLSAQSARLKHFTPSAWPRFWNVSIS